VPKSTHESRRITARETVWRGTYLVKDVWDSRCKYWRSFCFYVCNNFRPNSIDNEVIAAHDSVSTHIWHLCLNTSIIVNHSHIINHRTRNSNIKLCYWFSTHSYQHQHRTMIHAHKHTHNCFIAIIIIIIRRFIALISLQHKWRNGAMGRATDLRSTSRGFKFYLGQSCVTTVGKLFTPMCLCHQAV